MSNEKNLTHFSLFLGRKVYYDKKGYSIVWINGKNQKVHLLVWESHYGAKPKGHDIHHKDFNKSNFDIGNLELVTTSDHQRIHAAWVRVENEWTHKPCNGCNQTLPLNIFHKTKSGKHSALCRECHNRNINEKCKTDYAERKREYMRRYYLEHKKGVV